MRILVDTHLLLWALTNDARLPARTRELFEDPANELWCSVVSVWEVEIKHLAHPDELPLTGKRFSQLCAMGGMRILDIKEKHVHELEGLARSASAPPHKDPFDRMLICQAKAEGFVLVTHDARMGDYRESCVLLV